MKWALLYWYTTCAGVGCPIEMYKVEFYETIDECMIYKAAREALKVYTAVCIETRSIPDAEKD
jgi:hypothetical protein